MKKLNRGVRRLADMRRALSGAEEILMDAAEQVRARAASLAPVETGRLRDSLTVRDHSVVADCPYASAVELGTSRRAATPFLLPAARMEGARAAQEAARRALIW